MKTKLIIILLGISLTACTLCSTKSIKDAERYQSEGYPVRIAAYCTGLDGYLVGLGMWSSHAQAQVLKDGEWLWVSEFGHLTGYSTYTKRTMPIVEAEYVWWSLDDFRDLTNRRVELKRQYKNPCDLFGVNHD